MNRQGHQPRNRRAGYGCLAMVILLVVPAACLAVIFLWNINSQP